MLRVYLGHKRVTNSAPAANLRGISYITPSKYLTIAL